MKPKDIYQHNTNGDLFRYEGCMVTAKDLNNPVLQKFADKHLMTYFGNVYGLEAFGVEKKYDVYLSTYVLPLNEIQNNYQVVTDDEKLSELEKIVTRN